MSESAGEYPLPSRYPTSPVYHSTRSDSRDSSGRLQYSSVTDASEHRSQPLRPRQPRRHLIDRILGLLVRREIMRA